MDYVTPPAVLDSMIKTGAKKAKLSIVQLIIRGFIAAGLLGFATMLAYTFELQTNIGVLGAIVFPVGFVMVILFGLELVTGSFALIPVAVIDKQARMKEMLRNFFWVIIGHLLGGAFFALLFFIAITNAGQTFDHLLIQKLISVAEAKTIAYKDLGSSGMIVVLIKAIFCNWMVAMGTIMALMSTSTIGKIIAMWLPVMTFFALGFEHLVVNMILIPVGMILGAGISLADWLIWNGLPVTIGNFVGGFIFTGLAMYFIHKNDLKLARTETIRSRKTS